MWLDRSELYRRLPVSECCHHEYILSCRDSEVGSDSDIMSMICSLECYILTFAHVLISICCECMEMFVDRSLPDIAPTRIGDLERTEPREERRKEEYTNTDFFYLFSVEMLDRQMRVIHMDRTAFPSDLASERLYDREEGEDIADTRDVMQNKRIEKKSSCDEWQCCILGS